MRDKAKIALVRGKFLNKFEMQTFEPLVDTYELRAFGSLHPFHDVFSFPVEKLFCPMDLPNFPHKMPILNRIFTDAHLLYGLENKLKGFDLVHTAETYFFYTQQSLDAKKKGYVKKVLVTVLENIPFNNEGIRGRKEFKRRVRKEADHFLALSQGAKDALILEGVDPRKISVIGYGINTDVFKPIEKKSQDQKRINILFVGRLEEEKGIFELIFAAKRLLTATSLQKLDFLFTIVGSGSQLQRVIELEKNLKISKNFYHKEVNYNKIADIYRDADIFVAPSKNAKFWQEQFSIALLEAQASGLPIVSTVSGAIPENVGSAALLTQPGDHVSLAKALEKFILSKDLRFEYSKRARERAIKIHDAKKISKEISKLYQKVLYG